MEKVRGLEEKIRTEYMPKLPKELADYPSGHSLRDVYKKFAMDCYRTEHAVSLIGLSQGSSSSNLTCNNCFAYPSHGKLSVGADDEEQLMMQMPKDYWYRDGPTKCLLVCIVHRCNKENATVCSSLPAGP